MEKRIRARFYKTSAMGTEPVRDWLLSLDVDSRKRIGEDILTVELGWPVGMPVCRPLGEGLFEVRSRLNNSISRVIFCMADGHMWLLHGFIKKDQKTPQQDLGLARERMKELCKRESK